MQTPRSSAQPFSVIRVDLISSFFAKRMVWFQTKCASWIGTRPSSGKSVQKLCTCLRRGLIIILPWCIRSFIPSRLCKNRHYNTAAPSALQIAIIQESEERLEVHATVKRTNKRSNEILYSFHIGTASMFKLIAKNSYLSNNSSKEKGVFQA